MASAQLKENLRMANAKKSTKNVVALQAEPDLAAQVETLRQDIAELTKTVKLQAKATASEKVSTVKTAALEKAAAVKTAALETKDTAAEKYKELTTSAENSIREKPLTSVAVAVGAGLVLGMLTRR